MSFLKQHLSSACRLPGILRLCALMADPVLAAVTSASQCERPLESIRLFFGNHLASEKHYVKPALCNLCCVRWCAVQLLASAELFHTTKVLWASIAGTGRFEHEESSPPLLLDPRAPDNIEDRDRFPILLLLMDTPHT